MSLYGFGTFTTKGQSMNGSIEQRPPTPQDVEQIVRARTSGAGTTAFFLWLFLGGINAHIAYLNPKNRWAIIGVSILLLIFTLGASSLFWLISWIWLLPNSIARYREQVRNEVEAEILTRRSLYQS
jgi:hypothetical protein